VLPGLPVQPEGMSDRDDATDRAQLHGPARPSRAVRMVRAVTLVTVGCRAFDITPESWAGSALRSISLGCYAGGTMLLSGGSRDGRLTSARYSSRSVRRLP
jgi:hypothetical protein